jgi:hypothetical protein
MVDLEHALITKTTAQYGVYDLFGSPKSLYFVLDRVNQNQIAQNLFGQIRKNKFDFDIGVYSGENELPCYPDVKCGIYPSSAINTHLTGALIATSPETLKVVHAAMTPCPKYYYVYDVAWLNFEQNNPIRDQVVDIIKQHTLRACIFRSVAHMQYFWSKVDTSCTSTTIHDFNLALMHDFIYRK